MKYVINTGDMTKDPILGQFLIAPLIKNQQIVNCEPGQIDGGGVLLECDETRAQAVIDVLRLKYSQNKFRAYVAKGKTWKRI